LSGFLPATGWMTSSESWWSGKSDSLQQAAKESVRLSRVGVKEKEVVVDQIARRACVG
jgi:hypothetical protein